MKIKEFLTKQRISILVSSWVAAVLLVALAHYLEITSIWNGLVINLAAASFAVGITITYIDYILRKEQYLSVSEGLELAREEINAVIWQTNSYLARLYGFDFLKINIPKKNTKSSVDDLFKVINSALRTHLDQMQDEHDAKTIQTKEIKEYQEGLKKPSAEIDAILSRYGYALSSKEKSALLTLRKNIGLIIQLLNLSENMSVDSAVKNRVNRLHKQTMKDFPTYYP